MAAIFFGLNQEITETSFQKTNSKKIANTLYKKGQKCMLYNLHSMAHMNGHICKTIGSYRAKDDRYPVYVYKTKETALIKPSNLRKVKIKPPQNKTLSNRKEIHPEPTNKNTKVVVDTNKNGVWFRPTAFGASFGATFVENKIAPNKLLPNKYSQFEIKRLHSFMDSIGDRKRENAAKLFARNFVQTKKLEKRYGFVIGKKLNKDFVNLLNGGVICIKQFFAKNPYDLTLFNHINSDAKNAQLFTFKNQKKFFNYNRHQSVALDMIVDKLTKYFDVVVKRCKVNVYENGNDITSYHKDYYGGPDGGVDITIGASFGATRELWLQHEKTEQEFGIPQRNGDVFAFTTKINHTFVHSIPKQANGKCGMRYSVIVWGKQRDKYKWGIQK